MRAHEDLLELASVYALGALDGVDLEIFEAHLDSGCEECEAELRRALSVADDLVAGIEPVAPSPAVREALLARARGRRDTLRFVDPRRRIQDTLWKVAAVAAGVALVATLAVGWREVSATRDESERLAAELEESRQELAVMLDERDGLIRELESLDSMVGTATGPGTRAVSLAGTGPTPEARARAFLDPASGRMLLTVDNLPPLPPGQIYQLWVIVEGMPPVSVGIFELERDGSARFGGEIDEQLEVGVTIAVSIEPAGGVPQPTGPIVLAGA